MNHEDTNITIRAATAADQPAIRQMVRTARLDPTALDWSHFLIAEYSGQIVGIGQIRPYPKCRELGSLVVKRAYRKQGVGGRLMRALLAQETGTVYLECPDHMPPYYERFGFVAIPWWQAPMPLKFKAAAANIIGALFRHRIVVMKIELPRRAI